MGLFSGIKKAVKGVFKGIKKAFKSVVGVIGKAMNSKLGKVIMTAVAIYTGGLAIAGGVQGWGAAAANGAGFMGKFVAGAEGFITTLFNPIDATKNLMAGGGPLNASQLSNIAPNVANVASDQLVNAATGSTEASAISNASQGIAEGATTTAPSAVTSTAPSVVDAGAKAAETIAKEPSWLEKAANIGNKVLDVLDRPVVSGLIQGYGEGKIAEQQQEFDDRINRQWNDPNNAYQRQLKSGGGLLSGTIRRGSAPSFLPGSSPGVSTSGALPGEPVPIG